MTELHEQIGSLIIEDDQTNEERERIAREILDMTEVVEEAPGPEGPWYYRSLTIHRRMNHIYIKDVDQILTEKLVIPDLSHLDDEELLEKFVDKLDEVNEKTLAEL